jgi:PRTRC genetic system protein B
VRPGAKGGAEAGNRPEAESTALALAPAAPLMELPLLAGHGEEYLLRHHAAGGFLPRLVLSLIEEGAIGEEEAALAGPREAAQAGLSRAVSGRVRLREFAVSLTLADDPALLDLDNYEGEGDLVFGLMPRTCPRYHYRRRKEELERIAPGLFETALFHLYRATPCWDSLVHPAFIEEACKEMYWQGEDNEELYLEECVAGGESPAEVEVFRRSDLEASFAPEDLAPKEVLGEGELKALALSGGSGGDLARALLVLAGGGRFIQPTAPSGVMSECHGTYAFAILASHAYDVTQQVMDDYDNYVSECGWSEYAAFYFAPLPQLGRVLGELAGFMERLSGIERVLELIAERAVNPGLQQVADRETAAGRLKEVIPVVTDLALKEGEERLSLNSVLLIYASRASQRAYATMHEVVRGEGAPGLAEGHPLSEESLLGLARLLGKDSTRCYLPENVLCSGMGVLVWWEPPARRAVFFRESGAGEKIGTRSAVVPHPGLVFALSGNSWRVFALRGRGRPLPDTPLYQAHYWNLGEGGDICEGSTELPEGRSPEDARAWSSAYFASAFTHNNFQGVQVKGGSLELWRDLLDGKLRRFPQGRLVPAGLTLSGLIEEVTRT